MSRVLPSESKHTRAFTIVELLVCLAIASLLGALAINSIKSTLAGTDRIIACRNAQTIANITAAAISGGSPVFEGIADGDLDKAMRRVQANPIIYLRAGGKPISFNIGTYSTDDLARAKRYLRYENGHLIYLN